jgi:hypothetical protein
VQAYVDHDADRLVIMGIVESDVLTAYVASRLDGAGMSAGDFVDVKPGMRVSLPGIVVQAAGRGGNVFAAIKFRDVGAAVYKPADMAQVSLL